MAAYMLDRLKQLNTSEAVYNGLPLDEALIFDEGTERLCMQEENTLYNVSLLSLVPCQYKRGMPAHALQLVHQALQMCRLLVCAIF